MAESVGVIAVPETKIYKRNLEKDKALVICSDGVSEFMTDE